MRKLEQDGILINESGLTEEEGFFDPLRDGSDEDLLGKVDVGYTDDDEGEQF